MSNLLYPSIGNFTGSTPSFSADTPGITLGVRRSPTFNTGMHEALSGKETRIAYQLYPRMEWDLQYEFLLDTGTASQFKALFSLFMQMNGRYDTFLFNDPWFNTVTNQQFGTGDGSTANYQITALYSNTSGTYAGVGAAEIIQNFNGAPSLSVNGFHVTLGTAYTINGSGLVTFLSGHIPASGVPITWTGSFYYRARFDDDNMDFDQFLANFWEAKKVKLKQVKL